ncbi:hypothetical protein PoB_004196300 [Plakobranchus ocellatus]|uniref:Uncharacterized protein n=1 Tax=Plakobranchus ocellatus TaxID=259542 RepID=A0AAV4B766_9GAST|nr:hypothetical protein PoB_004196300 [Plakobranchus ocellatus]
MRARVKKFEMTLVPAILLCAFPALQLLSLIPSCDQEDNRDQTNSSPPPQNHSITVQVLELRLDLTSLGGGDGSTVACESALQGPFCRGFEPRYRRPGLTEGLKA